MGELLGNAIYLDGTNTAFVYDGSTTTNFTYQGALSSGATGINDNGQIVGWYMGNGGTHGFVYNYGGDLSFESFDYPGGQCSDTELLAINGQGQILGTFRLQSYPGCATHTFMWNRSSDGSFVNIDAPGSTSTWATGINANGQVAGFSNYVNMNEFVWSKGTFTLLPLGEGACSQWPAGINNYGRVVGFFYPCQGDPNYEGFWAVPTP